MHLMRKRFSCKRIREHSCLALCHCMETHVMQTQISVSTHSHLQPSFPLTNKSYESKLFPEQITVFPNSELFCSKVNEVLQKFLGNLQGCVKKKPIICCLSWHVFRPQGVYQELRVLRISASQSSSADFLNIIEMGHFNLLAYSFCFHFSASYHCRRKAR